MSEKPQDWDRSRDEIISGEYVLGVLSEDDRRRVEARIATDPKFAMQVRRWQENLADFNDTHLEIASHPAAYGKIEQRLFADAGDVQPSGVFKALWNSVGFWRGLACAALVLAAAVGLSGRFEFQAGSAPAGALVADLTGLDSPMSLTATYDPASGRLSITPAALRQDQPRSLEVWLMEDGKQPESLGVLPGDGRGDLVVPSGMRDEFAAGKTISITVEALGGSSEGKPSGPMVAFGKARVP